MSSSLLLVALFVFVGVADPKSFRISDFEYALKGCQDCPPVMPQIDLSNSVNGILPCTNRTNGLPLKSDYGRWFEKGTEYGRRATSFNVFPQSRQQNTSVYVRIMAKRRLSIRELIWEANVGLLDMYGSLHSDEADTIDCVQTFVQQLLFRFAPITMGFSACRRRCKPYEVPIEPEEIKFSDCSDKSPGTIVEEGLERTEAKTVEGVRITTNFTSTKRIEKDHSQTYLYEFQCLFARETELNVGEFIKLAFMEVNLSSASPTHVRSWPSCRENINFALDGLLFGKYEISKTWPLDLDEQIGLRSTRYRNRN